MAELFLLRDQSTTCLSHVELEVMVVRPPYRDLHQSTASLLNVVIQDAAGNGAESPENFMQVACTQVEGGGRRCRRGEQEKVTAEFLERRCCPPAHLTGCPVT